MLCGSLANHALLPQNCEKTQQDLPNKFISPILLQEFMKNACCCYFWNLKRAVKPALLEESFIFTADVRNCFPVHCLHSSNSVSITTGATLSDVNSFSQNLPRGSAIANSYINLYMAAICTWTLLPWIMHANRWNMWHDSVLSFTAPRLV